jgi:hypothetical protein
MQCVVHDPASVPDPKNCAFFPKRKQGQVVPIQPGKMVRKIEGTFLTGSSEITVIFIYEYAWLFSHSHIRNFATYSMKHLINPFPQKHTQIHHCFNFQELQLFPSMNKFVLLVIFTYV